MQDDADDRALRRFLESTALAAADANADLTLVAREWVPARDSLDAGAGGKADAADAAVRQVRADLHDTRNPKSGI